MPPSPLLLRRGPLLLLVGVGVLLHVLRNAEMLRAVWGEGAWFDTDDAMRMVTVRAFLDGQAWFDLVAHRMGGHEPVLMHWSRIVDLPLAAMIRGFGLLAPQPLAETLTRLAFPTLLFALLLVGLMQAAAAVAGPLARAPALLLGSLGGAAAAQFVPGRIDHHAPQIVLLTFAVALLLASCQPRRAQRAMWAGALFALSLSISIENLHFILAATGVLGLVWVLRGPEAAPQLRAYALGLAPAALLLFLATVPPGLRTAPICDAFGAAHLVGILAGAALLVGCSLLPLASWPFRLAAGALSCAAVILLVDRTYPACLGDPFVGLPPLLREVWLQNVSEAVPLTKLLGQKPWSALDWLGPPLLALAGLLWLLLQRAKQPERMQHLLLAVLCAVGLVATFWMVRTASSLDPLAMVAAAAAAVRLAERVPAQPGRLLPVLLPLALVLPASHFAWGMLETALAPEAPAAPAGKGTCTRPGDLRALADVPALRILTTMDAGPFILAQTHHAVLAGPYHRNIGGNLAALRTFLAKPADAAAIARASGARHLAFCAAQPEVDNLVERAPDGLAAHLSRGEVPGWLTNPVTAGSWTIFEIH